MASKKIGIQFLISKYFEDYNQALSNRREVIADK